MKDYKPMPGYETLYLLNEKGKIKALSRMITYKGLIRDLPQKTPATFIKGKTIYAVIRDKDFKNRKVNITTMIKNLFGRQKPILIKEAYIYKPKIKKEQVNKKGAAGKPVEQWNDGILVNTFKSIVAAGRAIQIDHRKISNACYGVCKYAAGYEWKFKEDNN